MRELVVCLLLCLAILAPRVASALETGVIEARSARYEPLDARIALHDVQAGDSGEIEVTLGSRSQFEIAGVVRPFHLTLIEFTVVEQEGGLAYIQLRTDDPIIEPSLTFLINVDWPRGHAIRGYNLKLSPPARGTTGASASRRTAPEGKSEPEAAPAAPAPSAPAPSTPAPSTLGGIADAAATPAPARAPGAASPGQASTALVIRTADAAAPGSPRPALSPTADGGAYGPVLPTDTLWAIASRFRPDDSISVHRMMLAFVEANPEAFDRGNVNGLNAGVTLRIPARDEIGLDDRAAVAEVRSQNQAWKQSREEMRIAPARTTPAPDVSAPDAPVSAAPSADSTPPAPAPAPPSPDTGAQPGGRLEVVAPGTAPDAAVPEEETDVQALRNELALAMEAADAKHLENEEIASRLVEAEKRIEDLYRLVELKDAEIAALQADLRAAAEAEPAPDTTQPEGEPLPDTAQPEGESAPDTAQPEEESAPEAEKSIIGAVVGRLPDTLAINPVFLVAAAGVFLLLLGVVALRRRRRRVRDLEDDALAPPAVLSTSGEAPPLHTGDDAPGAITAGRAVPAGRGSATATAGSAVKARDDTGDDAAGAITAGRAVPAGLGSATATAGSAVKARDAAGDDAPGAVTAGRAVPAGRGSATATAGSAVKARDDAGDDAPGAVTAGRAAPAGLGSATATAGSAVKARDDGTGGDFDFSIGGLTDSKAGTKADPASPADGAAAGGLRTDRSEAPAAGSRASAGAPAAGADRTFIPATDAGAGLDPGVDRGGSGGSTGTLPVQPDDGAVDEDETGVFAPDGSGGGIVQTKIDLAQVYMEMGDAENARLFLRQALSEGNADQREAARAMLSKLA